MTETAEPTVIQDECPFRWTVVRDKHVRHLEIDKIIQHEKSAEPCNYHKIFLDAAHYSTTKPIHKPALLMLAAIMAMLISGSKDSSKAPHFNISFQRNSRLRSVETNEYIESQLEIIRKCTTMTQNLVVKTHLEHLAWDIDRRDRLMAQRAIDGYIRILEGIYSEKFSVRGNLGPLSATSERILHMTINFHKHIGSPDTQKEEIAKIVETFFQKAYDSKDILCVLRFGKIAAMVNRDNATEVIEKFIFENKPEVSQNLASLWRLLAEIYCAMGNMLKYEECRKEEAEIYADMADRLTKDDTASSLQIAKLIRMAMDTYHNTKGNHNRYLDLRQWLVEVEKKIPAEMQKFSCSIDLRELAHSTIDEFQKIDFPESLMKFRSVATPLNSKQTMAEAVKVVSEFPFHTMLYSELTDDDGKTIAVSDGASVGMDNKPSGNFDHIIMKNEENRRGSYEMGTIDPARVTIAKKHRISEKSIIEALRHNPSVPANYIVTLSRGFERYFNGDWIAAVYILIPMFEAVIRHALVYRGYDLQKPPVSESEQFSVITLSKMIETKYSEIACVYDEGTAEDLYRIFCAKWGPRLRHRAIHALHSGKIPFSSDARYACWLIWRLSTYHLFYKRYNT